MNQVIERIQRLQVSIVEERSLLAGLYFLPSCRIILVVIMMLVSPLYGCATGQVIIASHEDKNANCIGLDKGLKVTQTRLQTLENTDSTKRNIRNIVLGVGGFIIPPLALFNVVFFLTDSYVADATEEKVLENRYNNMVGLSRNQECGSKYALIPGDKNEENNDPNT
ncbi:MAG: hypothetical protein HOL15_06745 [Nitrospinaceae bacterium]|nr:hypothetical protein [Nitrospinaceae bacterium]